jgi:hypothetical protein
MLPLTILAWSRPRRWALHHRRLTAVLWLTYLALDWTLASWLTVNVTIPLWQTMLEAR